MPEFMFILVNTRDVLGAMTEAEQKTHLGKYFNWINSLKAQGKFMDARPLAPERKLLSSKKGRPVLDGPFTETKEVVSGYFFVRAKNLDEAVEIAKGCPIFEEDGKVEVRELSTLPPMG